MDLSAKCGSVSPPERPLCYSFRVASENPLWIKICGLKTLEDVAFCLEAGADALGLNFVPSSPRFLSSRDAHRLVEAARALGFPPSVFVGVFADASLDEIVQVAGELELGWVQLHGHEPPAVLDALLARGIAAYQALRIGGSADVERASAYAGDRLLVDAKVEGQLGGSGQRVAPALVESLVRTRPVIVAGGLGPSNVGEVVRALCPFGVDTASGVEVAPGQKDRAKVRAFVNAARA